MPRQRESQVHPIRLLLAHSPTIGPIFHLSRQPSRMHRRPFNPDCGLDIATTTIRDVELLSAIRSYGYRVVLHQDDVHFIHESYYDSEGELLGVAQKPAEPCADTVLELKIVLEDMMDALDQDILTMRDLIHHGKEN
jgi:hypothetical protein